MDGLKQRIIGALVLVSLAVIFVPMIFDEPHSERQSTPITIPEEPPFPEVEIPEEPLQNAGNRQPDTQPVAPAVTENESGEDPGYRLIEESSSVDEGASTAETEAPADEPAEQDSASAGAETSDEPAADTSSDENNAEFTGSLEGAWIVQVASFGNEDNARRLRDRIVELGYDAHLQRFSGGETQFTRVFSGPFVDKSDAEDTKRVLDEEFDLDSLITKGEK
ncbi:MAG: SPOR domain-containing protein [Marinobacter sp.]|nr:SPOR domain-containing protein [Marinobacter sp.]